VKLVDADVEDPVESAPPPPPRLEKRKVSVSMLFTLAVLIGCVVGVFTAFPSRHHQVATSALAAHRTGGPWDLDAPAATALAAWAKGAVGGDPPLPSSPALAVVGARTVTILRRPAAVIRYRVGGDDVTLVLQRARDLQSRSLHRDDGALRVEAWRTGTWTAVGIGPAAAVATWLPALQGR
jgi:hypothetical protein